VADDFCGRYGDLLTGSYDCVDRVVLDACFPLGHNPGGFWCWWRRLHGGCDDQLDDAHLMRMAGRFARRVKAWAGADGVPVIYRKAGERRHLIEEFLERHPVGLGVFVILAAKAPASVWKVNRSPRGAITGLEKKTEYVYRHSFHIMDPAGGHMVVKMSGHPPRTIAGLPALHDHVIGPVLAGIRTPGPGAGPPTGPASTPATRPSAPACRPSFATSASRRSQQPHRQHFVDGRNASS
jgi:hypothetical protein